VRFFDLDGRTIEVSADVAVRPHRKLEAKESVPVRLLETLDEDTWHPHVYDFSHPEVTDQWGTANPMNELIAKESFNDVDRGVFVAPPV
jgi:hypothetical protein